MLLGPIDEPLSNLVHANFRLSKNYSQTDNWFVNNIIDFESYYQQRPSQLKNTLKRKEKKLANALEYQVKIVTSVEDLEQYFPAYQAIYQASWKGEEYSFAFIKQVCIQAAKENKLRLGVLFIAGKPAAMQLWFLEKGTASIFKLAYEPQYQQYSVGSILSMALSKHVITTDKVTAIEFGMGNEPYKKDWMAEKQQRFTVQAFNEKSFFGLVGALRHIVLSKLKHLVK